MSAACLSCRRWSPRRSVRHGRRARAVSARPIWPCMSFCPNWTDACWREHFRSNIRRGSSAGWRLPAIRIIRSRIGSVPSPIVSRPGFDCSPRREAERRIAVLLPDYPGAPGRSGYAVGLDVPASVIALLEDLQDAGYAIHDVPRSSRDLLKALDEGFGRTFVAARYIPRAVERASGRRCRRRSRRLGARADADPAVNDGSFRFRARRFGNVIVALPPDRGLAYGSPRELPRSCPAAAARPAGVRIVARDSRRRSRHGASGRPWHA